MFGESNYNVYQAIYHHYVVLRKEERTQQNGREKERKQEERDKRKKWKEKEKEKKRGLKFSPGSATSLLLESYNFGEVI